LIFIAIVLTACPLTAQKKSHTTPPAVAAPGVVVQPKIMVIPFIKDGEDLRTILEEDVNRRIAITKIKEGFDGRGYTTVDFLGKLKAAKDNQVFTSDNQSDIKSQIIDLSGADVYVQSEVSVLRSPTGTGVTLVLTGYEASTGNSLANKVGESGKFYTDDIGKLSARAVENCIEGFLNLLQTKFTEMSTTGKSVLVEFAFSPESEFKMSSETGSDKLPLSDQLEMWMEKNAFHGRYHIQGVTDVKMVFDDVRIPLKDANTGNPYNSNKFALEIFKFLKTLNMGVTKDVRANTIYITIK